MINLIIRLFFFVIRYFCTQYSKLRLKKYGIRLKVNSWCNFGNKLVSVGNYCNFNGVSVSGVGSVYIGDHFHSGSKILMITSNHNFKSHCLIPYDYDEIIKDIVIGDAVWVGSNVTILPGTNLGDGVIVQAGSVVHGNVENCMIIGGNPATPIGKRDYKIFKKLKKENKFVL